METFNDKILGAIKGSPRLRVWLSQVVTMAALAPECPAQSGPWSNPAPPGPAPSHLSRLASSVLSQIRPGLVTDSVNNQLVFIYILSNKHTISQSQFLIQNYIHVIFFN